MQKKPCKWKFPNSLKQQKGQKALFPNSLLQKNNPHRLYNLYKWEFPNGLLPKKDATTTVSQKDVA